MKCCTLIFHLQNLLAVKECDTCSTSHFLIQLYLALVNKQCPLCGCILLTHSLCLCHPLLCIPLGLQFCVIFAFPNWHFALASIHQLIPCLFPLLQHHLHSFWQSTKFLVWVIRWVHYLLCLTLCVRVRFQRSIGEWDDDLEGDFVFYLAWLPYCWHSKHLLQELCGWRSSQRARLWLYWDADAQRYWLHASSDPSAAVNLTMHHGFCLGKLSSLSLSLSDVDLPGVMLELSPALLKVSGGQWFHRSNCRCGSLSHYLFFFSGCWSPLARFSGVSCWYVQCTHFVQQVQASSCQGPGGIGSRVSLSYLVISLVTMSLSWHVACKNFAYLSHWLICTRKFFQASITSGHLCPLW